MKITAYQINPQPMTVRPAPFERPWMDATNERYAYRCLPLNIANAYGWELLCPSGFSAVWRGDPGVESITIIPDPGSGVFALSHFGNGVLTMTIPVLFRTEPGFDLIAQGPINRPRDGVSPLTGVIETDWAPFTFTMNWVFTRPGASVRFEAGEPFCHVMPVRRADIEAFEPEQRQLSDDAELHAEYEAWRNSRDQFNADLAKGEPGAMSEKWQKFYYQGRGMAPAEGAKAEHRTRMRLKGF
jgi:hypothetical protein